MLKAEFNDGKATVILTKPQRAKLENGLAIIREIAAADNTNDPAVSKATMDSLTAMIERVVKAESN